VLWGLDRNTDGPIARESMDESEDMLSERCLEAVKDFVSHECMESMGFNLMLLVDQQS